MKKIVLLLTALFFVGGTTTALADDLLLSLPPILAKSKRCVDYPACSAGPCYPGCPDPCVQCNLQCVGYPACSAGPCYPGCPDPCVECSVSEGVLNDTGIITKRADHDDSQYGRDITHNDPSDGHAGFSFEKISTCIRDKVTGLTWSPDLGTSSWTGTSTVISNNSTLCGLTDWRLPTIQELVSIVSYHRIDPAIDNDATRAFFNDTQSSNYWTSTANAADSSKRWAVNFAKGKAVNHIMESDDSGTIRVRLVRAEEAK